MSKEPTVADMESLDFDNDQTPPIDESNFDFDKIYLSKVPVPNDNGLISELVQKFDINILYEKINEQ